MRDVLVELKALRLHGMAGAWCDLQEQGPASGLDASRWLVEHLLQAETTDRAMRSVRFWCKFSARPSDFASALRRSGRKHRVPDCGRGLARSTQPAQVELALADAMQQLDAGDRHRRAVEDLEAVLSRCRWRKLGRCKRRQDRFITGTGFRRW